MTEPSRIRVIIMGAAGRDFHDFNVYWKREPNVEVVCFTASQIPNIAGRLYPAALAGPQYPRGIPIHPEHLLESLIRDLRADVVTFAYSDVSYEFLMHQASRVQAAGAGFRLLGPNETMLASAKPVVAVGATRTGCGKSQTSRRIAGILRALGRRVAVVRHPMPYGDLERQRCQRFASYADLEAAQCTIEEREEYEPHLEAGSVVFAGVDYERILRRAEREADVILWDGGNNDLPFFRPDLNIVVADPHRAGDELRYYPGETNVRMADAVIVNKVDTAEAADVARVEANVRALNPRATLIRAASPVTVEDPETIRGKRVLVVEDGPTLTHGGMRYGAGYVAAQRLGATIVDPRPYARGSIARVFEEYPQVTEVLPAMGYDGDQISELSATIEAVPCDAVLVATPIDLRSLLHVSRPCTRATYELAEHDRAVLPKLLRDMLERFPETRENARAGPSAWAVSERLQHAGR
jgi:predicted GTPase